MGVSEETLVMWSMSIPSYFVGQKHIRRGLGHSHVRYLRSSGDFRINDVRFGTASRDEMEEVEQQEKTQPLHIYRFCVETLEWYIYKERPALSSGIT